MFRVLQSVSNMDRAGIETMLMNYYRNIDRNEIQFDFLCNKSKPGDYDAEITSMGGRIFRSPGLNPIKRPEYMRFMRKLLADNPDIKILHAHNEAMAEYALEGAKKAGLPVRIFHSHNTRIEMDYKWPLKIAMKQLLRFNYTDMWACGHDAAVFYFGKKNVDAGRVHILRNAIDLEKFAFRQQVRNSLRAQYGLEGAFVIGHVGRFNSQKNHRFLIDAFARTLKQIPEAKLVLIGEGELMPAVKEQAKSLGIESSILLLGSIDNVFDWYSAMDVFAMPSLFEGLPVVSIEAQANGLKCMLSDKVAREADVSDDCQFIALDQDEWAKRLVANRNVRHNTQYAKNVWLNGYDIKTEAKNLMDDYKRLAMR